MKLSIAWIFDHLEADWQRVDVNELVDLFNKKTAEIESVDCIAVPFADLAVARVLEHTKSDVRLCVPEWSQEIDLPSRLGLKKDAWFLVRRKNAQYAWASGLECGGTKDILFPEISVSSAQAQGAWKERCQAQDYIIDVDNKSITHRPDLWGHRGIAREVGALLDIPLVPIERFIVKKNIIHHEHESAQSHGKNRTLLIEASDLCSRVVGLSLPSVHYAPSDIAMAMRLMRLDQKPINAIVDATNYAMLDLGHPMHAFDEQKLTSQSVVVRRAKNKEKLALLDGTSIELTADDVVIADGDRAVSLAGIMGGSDTAVTSATNSLFLEAACFDAATIRKTAARYKKRTEASARFEKTLDAQQAPVVIERFLSLLNEVGISYTASDTMLSVGKPYEPKTIMLDHSFIEQRIGGVIDPAFVQKTLEKLAFTVRSFSREASICYEIGVPSFRATKDVAIPEDIVEEVARFYGYATIAQQLPSFSHGPAHLYEVKRVRIIKQLLAQTAAMREIQQYAFFDEAFLRLLDWEPVDTLEVQSPVSENWRRLATTLMPHLFQAIWHNVARHDSLRFFEWARTWQVHQAKAVERKSLVGIIFEKKKSFDFYDGKAILSSLFEGLSLDVTWRKQGQPTFPWYDVHQTAELSCNDVVIGKAGMVQSWLIAKIAEQGSAFIFEVDGDFLLDCKESIKKFAPLAKYPEVERDISALVPLSISVDHIQTLIKNVDERIVAVTLVDFFQRPEWQHERSLTFRFVIRDDTATLTKEQVDVMWDAIAVRMRDEGATIR